MINMPITLPCGGTIPNRLCKAAMTEGSADPAGRATEALERLYGIWSDGGAGSCCPATFRSTETISRGPAM